MKLQDIHKISQKEVAQSSVFWGNQQKTNKYYFVSYSKKKKSLKFFGTFSQNLLKIVTKSFFFVGPFLQFLVPLSYFLYGFPNKVFRKLHIGLEFCVRENFAIKCAKGGFIFQEFWVQMDYLSIVRPNI